MIFYERQIRRWRQLDRVVRLILVNWALGLGVGATLALGVLAFDLFGLRALLGRTDVALLGAAMFVAMFALTFAGVVAATAAMRAGRDDDDDEPRGGRQAPVLAPIAARGAR